MVQVYSNLNQPCSKSNLAYSINREDYHESSGSCGRRISTRCVLAPRAPSLAPTARRSSYIHNIRNEGGMKWTLKNHQCQRLQCFQKLFFHSSSSSSSSSNSPWHSISCNWWFDSVGFEYIRSGTFCANSMSLASLLATQYVVMNSSSPPFWRALSFRTQMSSPLWKLRKPLSFQTQMSSPLCKLPGLKATTFLIHLTHTYWAKWLAFYNLPAPLACHLPSWAAFEAHGAWAAQVITRCLQPSSLCKHTAHAAEHILSWVECFISRIKNTRIVQNWN